jgi:hypothetical protein
MWFRHLAVVGRRPESSTCWNASPIRDFVFFSWDTSVFVFDVWFVSQFDTLCWSSSPISNLVALWGRAQYWMIITFFYQLQPPMTFCCNLPIVLFVMSYTCILAAFGWQWCFFNSVVILVVTTHHTMLQFVHCTLPCHTFFIYNVMSMFFMHFQWAHWYV